MVTYADVQELLEGRGRGAGEDHGYPVFTVVLERFMEGMHIQFAQGVPHVLGLDKQEKLAFAWANLWGGDSRRR